MNRNTVFIAVLLLSFVTGCTVEQRFTKQDIGLGTGLVTGALIGNTIGKGNGQRIATLAGALAGAYIGSSIGRHMDVNDRYRMNYALETTPDQQMSSWVNPNSGYRYRVTPIRTYERQSNSYGPCREYSTTVLIGGKRETAFGKVCRQSDGTWKIPS